MDVFKEAGGALVFTKDLIRFIKDPQRDFAFECSTETFTVINVGYIRN